jgi:SAM-dependent methyltransferase
MALGPLTHRGEGPGPHTSDGCAVELYLRVPYFGEVEAIAPSIPGPDVLELGCAVGRMTRHLLAHGYRVTAVDNSPEMLAHVPAEVTRVCANIEELDLGSRFDAVILASCLINTPVAERTALLAACHRHLKPGGRLVFERYDPAWLARAKVGPIGAMGEIEMHIDRVERAPDHVEMSLRYRSGPDEWVHHFTAVPLGDEQVRACLSEARFDNALWISPRWGCAAKNA